MPCSQNFLDSAKVFINNVDSNTLWLVNPRAKLATHCGISSFVEGDFTTVETPNSAMYQDFMQLLMREFPSLAASPYVVTKVQEVTFVNQAAILQRLSIATPILASLIQGDAILKAAGQLGDEPNELVKGALRYVDMLSSEVQK